MVKKVVKWYTHNKITNWKKGQSATVRRRHLLVTTDKRKSLHDRYVEAGRRSQALANVQKDKATKRLASLDARYFFAKAKKK